MDELLGNALNIAIEKFKEEFGKDAQIENGDEFVTCFANGTLILSVEDGELKIKIIGGKAYQSDYKIPVYELEEGAE